MTYCVLNWLRYVANASLPTHFASVKGDDTITNVNAFFSNTKVVIAKKIVAHCTRGSNKTDKRWLL